MHLERRIPFIVQNNSGGFEDEVVLVFLVEVLSAVDTGLGCSPPGDI